MSYPTFLPVFAFSDRYTVQHPDKPSKNQADCLVLDMFSGDVCVMQKVVAVSKIQAVIYCQQLKKLLSLSQGLSQPLVEQTIDCFVSDRSVVVVKKPVAGQLYSDIAIEKGQFTEREIVLLLKQVLATLSVLHQNSIRHCNLSPDTICLRTADGNSILTQFGFFRDDVVNVRVDSSPTLQSQAFCLTGMPTPRDDREDLYSLALTAMMLLTGQPLSALFDSQAGRWSWEAACSVGQDLSRTLNRMLSSYESDWFVSADEFLFALSLIKAEAATLQAQPALPQPALPLSQLSPMLWSQKDGIEIVKIGMLF